MFKIYVKYVIYIIKISKNILYEKFNLKIKF